MFGYATLQTGVAATVLARAEAGVAGDLAPIAEAAPITDLPVDDHAGHFPQPTWLLWSGGALQLSCESADLFLQSNQDWLAVLEQLFYPVGYLESSKSPWLPPVLDRLQAVIDQETASLGF